MPRLIDISPPVNDSTPVLPGDTAYRQTWVAQIAPGCPVNVSAITTTPHAGAHADAPLHYDPDGEPIGVVSLAPYIGRCRVVHAIGAYPIVTWDHVAHALSEGDTPPRVLIRTYTHMPWDRWDDALAGIDPLLVDRLAAMGVQLIGIDTASIDPANSKTLECHQAVRRHRMRVLENLLLDDAPEGDYELIALPLKLTHADASPVRAVLRTLD